MTVRTFSLVAALAVLLPAQATLAAPSNAPPGAVAEAAREAMLHPSWLDEDPGLAFASNVQARARRFGARVIVRAIPEVDGVPVEGADRILAVDGGDGGLALRRGRALRPLRPLNSFLLDEAHATAVACGALRACVFTDPTVENISGFARKVWLASDDGITAAFRVRVPTIRLEDMRDVWVDAETGVVLLSQPTARFQEGGGEGEGEGEPGPAPAFAHVFVNDQPSDPDAELTGELEVVELRGLLPAAVGGPLRGEHFETFNCCKHFICLNGGADCLKEIANTDTRPEEVAICADADDPGATVSNVDLAVPAEIIPIAIPGLGDTLFARVAFCAELPRLRSEVGAGPDGEDGWFATPVDKDRSEDTLRGLASEEDAFVEVQAYHATQVFFEHIRDVLENPAFCLEQVSMDCNENGDPVLDDNGEPVLPFHITTNVLIPELNFNDIGTQILGGQGRTAEDPIIIDDYQRIPNAAFVPALEEGPINVPPEFQVLTQLFSRPFDSNIYFQGFRDFAYDGDVVRHEFTHAIVHTLNPQLLSVFRDDYGAHAEPGAMNEGWSDYFSSSFIGNSPMGEYASDQLVAAGETGLRDAVNENACPQDIIGQVHYDSQGWTGALWATRETIANDAAKVKALDRALLAAIAEGDADETFTKAGERAIAAIVAEELLGQSVADTLAAEFESRGITGCERVWPLAVLKDDGSDIVVTRKDELHQPGKADIGLSNFAPSVMQLRVEVPAKSAGFTLSWSQAGGGLVGGGDPAPMLALVHETGERIHWTYEGSGGSLAVPRDADGNEIPFDANGDEGKVTIGAADNNGNAPATFTHTLESSCESRSFVVQILAPDASAVLTNIDVENLPTELDCRQNDDDDDDDDDDRRARQSCGCRGTGDATPFAALAIVLVALRRRRR